MTSTEKSEGIVVGFWNRIQVVGRTFHWVGNLGDHLSYNATVNQLSPLYFESLLAMLRTLTLTLAICFCGTIFLHGQESQLAPQHKKLHELEGKWTFTLKAGDGPEAKGECEYKSECSGLWLTSDFRTEFDGMKFQGKGFDGYDTAKKKYVSVWVDSMTSAPMHFEGDFDAKGEKLNMVSSAPGPDGKPGTWRSVTTINSPDKHVFEMFFKPQGGEEMQMMTIMYTRKGK